MMDRVTFKYLPVNQATPVVNRVNTFLKLILEYAHPEFNLAHQTVPEYVYQYNVRVLV
jgi:hypothetical protein